MEAASSSRGSTMEEGDAPAVPSNRNGRNHKSNTGKQQQQQPQQQQDSKRQQFTNKQRMDMYAFCVLELEMHSNKVSIKKQQQAIQRVLLEQKKERLSPMPSGGGGEMSVVAHAPLGGQQQSKAAPQSEPAQQPQLLEHTTATRLGLTTAAATAAEAAAQEAKTLLELQEEVAMMRKCYSDYQKTQVLTSCMLREVQKRFARYYPASAIPSRTTIKHVFEKCVLHGTVENIKTPRKATKIPQGDEIEHLLIHEPQLSLRQMAQKLNVSTGTVSRRCKALGLVPESVTIKHQQLATARRQKQIKQLESHSKQATLVLSSLASANQSTQQLAAAHHPQQPHQLSSNGNHELLTTPSSQLEHATNVIN